MTIIRVKCYPQFWEATFESSDHGPIILPAALSLGDVITFLQRRFPGAGIEVELSPPPKEVKP
jgi:hypothetical protein